MTSSQLHKRAKLVFLLALAFVVTALLAGTR